MRPPREFFPGFGTIKASFRRCTKLLPEVSPVFDRTKANVGEIFPTHVSLPEVSLEMRPPGESSLGFGAIKVSFCPCSDLLPVVSPVFDRTEATLEVIFSTYASLPEFSLEMHPPRELYLRFDIIEASSWRCSNLLPGVSPVLDRTEATLGEIFSTYASLPEVSLEMRPPRESFLGFGIIKAFFWHCSDLLPEVSPVFDRTEATLGEIFPTYASLPEVFLEMRHSCEFSLGFGTTKASIRLCTKLLPEVSPVFDRTEATLGDIFPTHASLPEVSLEMRPPRDFSLGFGTIKAFFWCYSDLLPVVSPVFDRAEATLGEIFPTYVSLPEVSLEVSPPPVSSLSGSVPSRHLFGAVAIYNRRSLQFWMVQKLLLGKSFPLTPAFQRSLWKCFPREFFLVFGTIKASFWRCSNLLPVVIPVFDRTEATLGEILPTYASLPEVSLEMRPPSDFSLGFGTIKHFFWRCTKLLPEDSPVFDSTEANLGDIFPTYASLPEFSLEMRPPRESSLRVRYHQGIFLALYQTNTGGLSSI